MHVVHYGKKKKKRKTNLIGQWKMKAVRPGQAVRPGVVLYPQEEGTAFLRMHKGATWTSSGPVNNKC